jgi:spermidine synthase
VRSSLSKVASFLFFSGACALVYQVAWFRELRLIFGASTSASAAVLAVFMAGLGIGGARLGRKADAAKNPLLLYANLEIAVACTAAATPLLVSLADRIYVATGGSSTLGNAGATLVRLVLSVVVLAPSTFLMGGTLPAAARAVEQESDAARKRVAVLYGTNTFGAVLGTLLANFVLLEVFGTQLTLWFAALVNVLVAVFARATSRRMPQAAQASEAEEEAEAEAKDDAPAVAARAPWLPPAAAALAGGAFMLMELVWYRMLGPLLGGSSYTFGLILAVALAGIGLGGALYARMRFQATLRALAVTYGLEALFIVIPYALGDKIAIATAILRPFNRLGFAPSVVVWGLVAAFVVMPAAIVSGAQFPLIIGLYGKGAKSVGRDVGQAYLANTIGTIAGSLGGGFGLVPLLGALGSWKLVVGSLVAGAVVALAVDIRERRSPAGSRIAGAIAPSLTLAASIALLFAEGPTAVWRHSGIGAGRADRRLEPVRADVIADFLGESRRGLEWEADGVESGVGLGNTMGYTFIVNGKSDGHSIGDGPTQVMSGLLPALLHPTARKSMVIGLGTGSSAGWLGKLPSMERVDVVELEPAILRVARECTPVNMGVLDNPKVHIQLADAREVLRTKKERYDLIFSEPSNPYRAGISSMFTLDFYRAIDERLAPGGIFVHWLQGYDIDGWGLATAIRTLRQVFGDVTFWETTPGDFLFLARREAAPVDMDRIRERIKQEPFATAIKAVWRTDSAEGALSHYVASNALAELIIQRGLGAINTDDQNLLEFTLARNLGHQGKADVELVLLARAYGFDRQGVVGAVDWDLVDQERVLFQEWQSAVFDAPLPERPVTPLRRAVEHYRRDDYASVLKAWKKLGRAPRSMAEATMLADAAAHAGGPEDEPLLAGAHDPIERDFFLAQWHARHGDPVAASDALVRGFVAMRTTPWPRREIVEQSLRLASDVGRREPALAPKLAAVLAEPFAVEAARRARLVALARLGDVVSDTRVCVAAQEALTPPILDRTMLQMRARCFKRASHPGLDATVRALAEIEARNTSFPIPLPSPLPLPVAKKSAPDTVEAGAADAGTEDAEPHDAARTD